MTNVIDKIRKLHALAERATTEHEAALAASRAQELLTKHNLELGSVLLKEDPGVNQVVGRKWRRIPAYCFILGRACDNLFDVLHFFRGGAFCFIGIKANVETACITYEYLLESVEALARGAKATGSIYGPDEFLAFRVGAATRIGEIAREHKAQSLAVNPVYGELVHVGNAIAQKLIGEIKFTRKSRGGGGWGFSSFGGAFNKGYAEGSRVDLHGARTNRMLK